MNLISDITKDTQTVYTRGVNLIVGHDALGVPTYYLYNAHGDVVQLVDNAGSITKEYRYDAFGVERNKDENDPNPFRYTAEYYDKEIGTIYLRMRYYIPHLGRFLTEDPIRDGLNWYTYAAGNPITFIDPMGLSVKLAGTSLEQRIILKNLQSLTDHTLDIDDDGMLYIAELAKLTDIWRPDGNELIRRLIEDEFITSIMIIDRIDSKGEEVGNGIKLTWENGNIVSALVEFVPYSIAEAMTKNSVTGNIEFTRRPDFIGLAHELIHADRAMRGNHISYDKKADIKFEHNNIALRERYRREEYATIGITGLISNLAPIPVGIWDIKKGDITENMIRAEHGLHQRATYGVHKYVR